MTRVLVLILVVPPLLMPPGMCVCQYSHGVTQPGPHPKKAVESHPTPVCTCESCRDPRSAESPEYPAPAKPAPTDHAPGCPAALDAAQVAAVVPAVAAVTCDLALAPLDQPMLEPSRRLSHPTDTPAAPSPSRALAHRVLLI
jgi:hypothetical protein